MRSSNKPNLIREIWERINKDLKKALKFTARISEQKTMSGKTYFIVQLIGKNTCTQWMTAFELGQNKKLFSALSPSEQEEVNRARRIECNVGDEKVHFFISAIDFEPDCMMSVTSINGMFQMKLTPREIFQNKRIFHHINSANQRHVKFYAGIELAELKKEPTQSYKIIPFRNFKSQSLR